MLYLPRCIHKEIFFHVEPNHTTPDSDVVNTVKVVLHFLGKIDESRVGLYQTKLSFKKGESEKRIYQEMKAVFEGKGQMRMVQGRISELYISLS